MSTFPNNWLGETPGFWRISGRTNYKKGRDVMKNRITFEFDIPEKHSADPQQSCM
jgi:hypothetical protein